MEAWPATPNRRAIPQLNWRRSSPSRAPSSLLARIRTRCSDSRHRHSGGPASAALPGSHQPGDGVFAGRGRGGHPLQPPRLGDGFVPQRRGLRFLLRAAVFNVSSFRIRIPDHLCRNAGGGAGHQRPDFADPRPGRKRRGPRIPHQSAISPIAPALRRQPACSTPPWPLRKWRKKCLVRR